METAACIVQLIKVPERDLKVNKRCWNECAEVHPAHNQHVQLPSRSLKQEQLPDLPCHLPHACTLIPKSKSFSTTLEQLRSKEVDQKKSSTRKSSLNNTESHGFCLFSSLHCATRVSCNHASRAMRSTKSRVKRYATYRV